MLCQHIRCFLQRPTFMRTALPSLRHPYVLESATGAQLLARIRVFWCHIANESSRLEFQLARHRSDVVNVGGQKHHDRICNHEHIIDGRAFEWCHGENYAPT